MNVEQLVVELETADPRRRNALARAGAASATEDELLAVIRLLVNPVKSVRLGAMEVLAYARFRPAMPYLVDVTRKRSGDDRVFAARAVAAMIETEDKELERFARQWVASNDPVLELHGATILNKLGLTLAPPAPTAHRPPGPPSAPKPPSPPQDPEPPDEMRPEDPWTELRSEQELRRDFDELPLSDDARAEITRELERMRALPAEHPEYEGIRAFLRYVRDLPWGKRSPATPPIAEVSRVLDERHWGLRDAKRQVLEYIAVEQLRGRPQARVLCLVGPPGVGKTSFARAVARSMQRPFAVLSLGGVDDEVQIRGFERTYIRSRPGRVIRAMVKASVMNPVMLLDEIDKLGRRWSDPAAALLELLDPETNTSFVDSYLQFGFDFSQTLFICSANVGDQIDPVLRDRMEIIELEGYTARDKIVLAMKHLVPAAVAESGLSPGSLGFTEAALEMLVREYSAEPGVRDLARAITSVCRAHVHRNAERGGGSRPAPVTFDAAELPGILGKPRRRRRLAQDQLAPGCAYGLSWTASDGELLPVECALLAHGSGKLVVTGQLGEVLKESIEIAIAVLRRSATLLGIPASFRDDHDLHVHLPDTATKKEGPSAGVAIAVALYSHLQHRPTRADTGMTGELTLHGRVTAIGGVKTKLLAAMAAGLRRVILPEDNRIDVEHDFEGETPPVELVYVRTLDEAIAAAFEGHVL
ncbi:MAG: lon [Deltaproteobacteria bacterium]|nr:lon [Deltaproteobacteria bacterium]